MCAVALSPRRKRSCRVSRSSSLRDSEPEEIQLGDERFLGTSLELGHRAKRLRASERAQVLRSGNRFSGQPESSCCWRWAWWRCWAEVRWCSSSRTPLPGRWGIWWKAFAPWSKAISPIRWIAHGGDEVAEVTGAFDRMRNSLLKTQQELLEAERLATIGRMASSISHDLRHSPGGHCGQRGIPLRKPLTPTSAKSFIRKFGSP